MKILRLAVDETPDDESVSSKLHKKGKKEKRKKKISIQPRK
jgi:hypothetical protein